MLSIPPPPSQAPRKAPFSLLCLQSRSVTYSDILWHFLGVHPIPKSHQDDAGFLVPVGGGRHCPSPCTKALRGNCEPLRI